MGYEIVQPTNASKFLVNCNEQVACQVSGLLGYTKEGISCLGGLSVL